MLLCVNIVLTILAIYNYDRPKLCPLMYWFHEASSSIQLHFNSSILIAYTKPQQL